MVDEIENLEDLAAGDAEILDGADAPVADAPVADAPVADAPVAGVAGAAPALGAWEQIWGGIETLGKNFYTTLKANAAYTISVALITVGLVSGYDRIFNYQGAATQPTKVPGQEQTTTTNSTTTETITKGGIEITIEQEGENALAIKQIEKEIKELDVLGISLEVGEHKYFWDKVASVMLPALDANGNITSFHARVLPKTGQYDPKNFEEIRYYRDPKSKKWIKDVKTYSLKKSEK